jgi:exopolysaccharide biosynthesis polyprenyl glycosylphosphotransferase
MNSPTSRSTITWLLVTIDIFGLLACFNLVFLLGIKQPLDWMLLLFFTLWVIAWRLVTEKWIQTKEEELYFLVLGTQETAINFELECKFIQPKTKFVFLTDNQTQAQFFVEKTKYLLVDKREKFAKWSEHSWSGIVIDNTLEQFSDELFRELMTMRLQGICVYKWVEFYEKFGQKIPPIYIKDDWFIFTSGFNLLHDRLNAKFKRFVDIMGAGLLLIATLPLLIFIPIAIKLDSPGSIFYSQVRTGLNGKKFRVYKFRSMHQNAEQQGIQWAKDNDPRITRVGRWLRLTRIDELPQLWNVIRGEMSLVGPRPERPEFDALLRQEIPYYDVRYLIKPGITGWAQVSYPYGASVEDAYQKVAYDLYYLKNYSLLLDAAIALKTIRVMLLGKGR